MHEMENVQQVTVLAEGGDLRKTQVILAKGGYFHKRKTVYQLRVEICTKRKFLY
jgi:hypothetical protein